MTIKIFSHKKTHKKFHISRNFEVFGLIFGESLYLLISTQPKNSQLIPNFDLQFVIPYCWNAPYIISLYIKFISATAAPV